MSRRLDEEEISRQLRDLPAWSRRGDSIVARYRSPGFLEAVALVEAVAPEAQGMNHHPDIDIRYDTTSWTLSTHDAGGLTQLDIELAHRIDAAARAGGASGE